MAAADDRRALSARAPAAAALFAGSAWSASDWCWLLLAVALVQARQFSLLHQAVQTGDDYVVLMVYQAETEHLRLRDSGALAADDRQPLDDDALRCATRSGSAASTCCTASARCA